MTIKPSVLLFLLFIAATWCWVESLQTVPSVDEVLQEVGASDAEDNVQNKVAKMLLDLDMEENEIKAENEAQNTENEEENVDKLRDFGNEDAEPLQLHSTEESDQEDPDSDIDNEIDNDDEPRAKQLSDLGISKSDLRRVVVEAEEEVKRNNPKIPADSSNRLTYQAKHYRRQNDPESEERTRQALIMERVMEKLAKKLGLSNDEAFKVLSGLEITNDDDNENLNNVDNDNTNNNNNDDDNDNENKRFFFPRNRFLCRRRNLNSLRYRTLDGLCNNLRYPCRGAANTPFRRLLRPDYADRKSKPRISRNRFPLPNARRFSSRVFLDENHPSRSLTHITMTWGQFLDHDITLSAEQETKCPTKHENCRNGGECFGVSVPTGDPHFSRIGVKCLHLVRSAPASRTRCNSRLRLGQRQQSNTLTAFIDASQVYGVNRKTLDSLLVPGTSFLKVGSNDLLPPASPEGFCRGNCTSTRSCFKAGDVRVNENPALASMHTLFMREHNRIARKLTQENPQWSTTKVFEETRKIIGAQMQHITYNEFLPQILSPNTRRKFRLTLQRIGFYRGYKGWANPSIFNSFATAAFRFGHSLVRNHFSRPGRSSVPTAGSFYNPCPLHRDGVDSIFPGLSTDPAQSVDRSFAEALTKNLVLGKDVVIDLPAINIQRGRDHGLPGYNKFRRLCGLKKARRFSDFGREISFFNRLNLFIFYRHVDNVDLFAGGIMEKPLPGSAVGPTFSCLLARQFRELRRGDRFWYENKNRRTGFTAAQLAEIRKISLARVICDNTRGINSIQPKVMQRIGRNNRLESCEKLPCMNLRVWK